MSTIKKESKSSDEVNYTLYNQKLTIDFSKGHLWNAADILSSLNPSEYRQTAVLFLKRLNDTFEEKAEKLISEGKNQKEAYDNKNRQDEYLS